VLELNHRRRAGALVGAIDYTGTVRDVSVSQGECS
jgi:hypothetical protein